MLLFVSEAPHAKVAAWEVISQAMRYTDEGKSEYLWSVCGSLAGAFELGCRLRSGRRRVHRSSVRRVE